MQVIRRAVEEVTRHWQFKRRVPREFGRSQLWVSPSGGLRYLLRPMSRVDPELLRVVEEVVRPGDCVWDVGASLGLFSIAAAARAGRQGSVYAFEPDTWMIDLLRRSARIQTADVAPISVVPTAVASEVALRSFCTAKRARATNFLSGYGSTQSGGIAEENIVPVVSLDWLKERIRSPHVVKIDVEGAELEVLQGASMMLNSIRPIIICEVSARNAEAVAELLSAHHYVWTDGSQELEKRAVLQQAPWFTLAFPREELGDGNRLTRPR